METFLERKLILRPVVEIVTAGEECYLATIGTQRKLLEGGAARLLPYIMQELRGDESVESVAESASRASGIARDDVVEVMHRLYEWAIIDNASGYEGTGKGELDAQLRFFSLVSSCPRTVQERLQKSSVVVLGEPRFGSIVVDLLVRSGVGHVHDGSRQGRGTFDGATQNLVIHASRSRSDPGLREENDRCLDESIPMLVLGSEAYCGFVGPLVLPRQTACIGCLHADLDEARSRFPQGPALVSGAQRVEGELHPFPHVVAGLAVTEALKFLSGVLPVELVGRRLVIDPIRSAFSTHEVRKLPRCSSCGPIRTRSPIAAFEFARELA